MEDRLIEGKQWKNWLTGAGIAVGIYLVFRYILPLVWPFVIAGIVSVFYYPLLRKWLKDREIWSGRKKQWALALAVVLLYFILLCLLFCLAAYLFRQGQSIFLNFPFYQAKAVCLFKNCCCQLDAFLHMDRGMCYEYIKNAAGNMWSNPDWNVLPRVTGYSVQMAGQLFRFAFEIFITVIATFFIIQDYEQIRGRLLLSEDGRGICRVLWKCRETFRTYMKAQGLIMLLDGVICTAAFFIIRQPYYLVLGPLTAIVDAFPVLGAGLVLIPCIFYLLFAGELGKGAVLFAAYLICLMTRQITEPKMIGNKVGMNPLLTIISMYAGFQLFGVSGFLLGPVGVLIGKETYRLLRRRRTEKDLYIS